MSIQQSFLPVFLLVTMAHGVLANTINYRLPEKNVKPIHYDIKLEPNIVKDKFTFWGESNILIDNVETLQKTIVLHAKNLTIVSGIWLTRENGMNISETVTYTLDLKTDFLILTLSNGIRPGKYILNLRYTGLLHDDMNGFYRSSYKNDKGEEKWMAATQFKPTHARRAFPCFDEPALKATFQISITHLDTYKAVSNMPFLSIQRVEGSLNKQTTMFGRTPEMSTYLVAFVLSDFKFLTTDDGKIRVWSRDNAVTTGEYARFLGQEVLADLETFTKIERVIPKMDNFAIPQFRGSVTENWGILTYSENSLLFEEGVTSTVNERLIASSISHGIAHQWFGNLVTPTWWDYTWLNEGFANYLQYYITDKIKNSWRFMDQFVINNLQETAFIADDNETQHAMNAKVFSPTQISEIFDSISYAKAGCVIRMISHAVGNTFQTNLQNYLKDMRNKTVTPDDLFDAFGKKAKEQLESWVTQAGYPVITVIRNHDNGKAEISQHRFLTTKDKNPSELWYIPINYATRQNPQFYNTKPKQWLEPTKKHTTISGLATGWVIFNIQQTGYYRVNYDAKNWALITEYLKSKDFTKIHVLNRAQLLDDSFHLAQAGEVADFSTFFKISAYLKQEEDYVPWYAAFRAFAVLDTALANTENYKLFKLYVSTLIVDSEKNIAYTESVADEHMTKLHRMLTVKWACHLGSSDCIAFTHKKLIDYVNGSKNLSTDLRKIVLCAGIRTANVAIWNKMFALYENSTDQSERTDILDALGCSPDRTILKKYMAKTIEPMSKVPVNAAFDAICTGSASGIDVVFDFIVANHDAILAIDSKTETILKYLNKIGSRMTTDAQMKKLNRFIGTHKEYAEGVRAKGLADAQKNINWIKKYEPTISSFLKSQELVEKPSKNAGSSGKHFIISLSLIIYLVSIALITMWMN